MRRQPRERAAPSFRPLLRHRWAVLLGFALLGALLAPGLGRLVLDNDPEAFFPADAAAVAEYRSLERDFGPDRGVRLVLRGETLWSRQGLAWLGELERAAGELHGVAGAGGVVRLHRWHVPDWPPADPLAFRHHVVESPLDREAGWITPDASTVTVLVGLHRQRPAGRRRALAELERLIAQPPAGVSTAMVGVPVLERAVDRGVMQLLRTILPLVTAAMVIVLLLVFGLRLDALAPLLLVGLSELVLFGAMGYAGARLHFVVAVVAPILLVVGLASAVHVLFTVRDRRKGGCDAVEAVVAAYRVKAWPVLWTGITTGVGFGSFASSPSLAIQSLGLWSAFGLTFLTFALLTFYPALLASLGGRRPAPPLGERVTNAARSIGARLFVRASSRPRACHLLFALTAAAAALGMPRLTLDTDLLHYVRPSSPARAEIERLEETGVGVLAADVVLTISGEGRAPGPLQGLDGLAELASLTDELRTLPAVLSGVSAADLVETVARHCLDANADTVAEGQGGSTEALARIAATPELDRTLRFLLTPSGRRARVSLLLHAGGIEELGPTLDDAAARARSRFPEAEVTVTGQYPLVLAAQGSILRSMALALGLTFLVVVVLFRIAVRTWNAAARALLANVWVVLVVLGVMGWTGTALDSVTIMVASAALGLVVDDTLHFIGFLRHELHPDSGGIEPASLRALRQAVPGHVLTSLVLTMGFAAVGLSPLVPVARFGTFLALAVVVALVADLVWVPTLLGSLRGRAAQRLRAP